MRILVFGAGAQGSLLAARLHGSGQQVSLLARGQRLANLNENSLVIEDLISQQRTVYNVPVVERLAPEDEYDWVLVTMGKAAQLKALPVLAANRKVKNFIFFGNNVDGAGELAAALGRERVLLGFLMVAGKVAGPVAYYAHDMAGRTPSSLVGELDGSFSARAIEIAAILENAGIPVEISPHIEAWLKCHAALIVPLGGAYFLAGCELSRMAGTRDVIVIFLRAVREALQVLRVYHLPLDPPLLKLFLYLPEPLLVPIFQRRWSNPMVSIGLIHASTMQPELRQLGHEFCVLARRAGCRTPHFDHLTLAVRPDAHALPAGSQRLPLDWRPIWMAAAGLAGLLALAFSLNRRRSRQI